MHNVIYRNLGRAEFDNTKQQLKAEIQTALGDIPTSCTYVEPTRAHFNGFANKVNY